MPGKPADHWLPPEVYDPGEWGVDDVYLFIISDGSISRKPRLKPPPKREPPPEEPAPCRTCGQSPAELAAAHAALVAALQAEFYADDLQPPPSAAHWSYGQLRTFFESGGLQVPPDATFGGVQ